jgi:hypothetical protein
LGLINAWFTRYYSVLLGFTRFYSVLLGITRYYSVLLGFTRLGFRFRLSAFSFQLSVFSLLPPPYLPIPEKAVTVVTMLIIKYLARYITRYNPSCQAVTKQPMAPNYKVCHAPAVYGAGVVAR